MNKVKEFFKKRRAVLSIAIALLLVAAIGAGFGISAKYRRDITIPGQLIIDAGLAKSVAAVEHKAVRAADGSYELDTTEETNSNEFIVVAGIDLPRDPFVRITEKTNVPAYLYIEVVKTDNVACALTDEWVELPGITGKNGGSVYYYTGTLPKNDLIEIPILTGSVTVGDGEAELSFYPYMVAAPEESSAATSFDEAYISSGTTGAYTPGAANAPDVVKETDGTVDVENNDDQSVYVRAAVIVNWKMEDDGSFFGKAPQEGVDYTFTQGEGWFKASDGFYYYSSPVAKDEEAPDLVKLFTPVEGGEPDGCTLSVTIDVQTIQAAAGAVADAWGCTVNADGTISK